MLKKLYSAVLDFVCFQFSILYSPFQICSLNNLDSVMFLDRNSRDGKFWAQTRRSEVRFLMGTQNFSFVPRSWQDAKISFSISLPSSKLAISLIPIFDYLVLKREEFVYYEARASDWPIYWGFNYLLKWVIRPVSGHNCVLLLFNDNIWAYDFYSDNFFYLMTELQIYNLLYSTVFIL